MNNSKLHLTRLALTGFSLLVILALLIAGGLGAGRAAGLLPSSQSMFGRFEITWGDSQSGQTQTLVTLTTEDGQIIPLLGYDWDLIKGPKTGDIYFLTGSVGNFRIWEGEHLSASVTVAENPEAGYFESDGGRMIWRIDTENLCRTMKGWIMPRLFNKAPWSQVRFMNVQCETPGGFLSPDPTETSFYPLTSFSQANCP